MQAHIPAPEWDVCQRLQRMFGIQQLELRELWIWEDTVEWEL